MPLPSRPGSPALIGVLHLAALPGAPRPGPALSDIVTRAVADARALRDGGADGLILENFGDAPFTAGRVDAITVAAMTRVTLAVREAVPDLLVGVNVLRNDAVSALSIAAATGASFVRVNVLSGAMVTDQGVITGCARELILARRLLAPEVSVVADVMVKHAVPLGDLRLEDAARDAWERGGADALIVTGAATGHGVNPDDLDRVRAAIPMAPPFAPRSAPVWIGSGLDPERARAWRGRYDAAIVGTWLHTDGRIDAPLDPARVATLREAMG